MRSIQGKPHFRQRNGWWHVDASFSEPAVGYCVSSAWSEFLRLNQRQDIDAVARDSSTMSETERRLYHGGGCKVIVDPAQSCEVSLKSLIEQANAEQLTAIIRLATERHTRISQAVMICRDCGEDWSICTCKPF